VTAGVAGPRTPDTSIAIIGMAGRFPGAGDVAAFCRNMRAGVESITRFSAADLRAAGRDAAYAEHPHFVGAEGVLEGVEIFDARFFGYSPREAAIMDPQHRLALQEAWHAFDDAGYDPARCDAVGVFLSAALSSYLVRNLLTDAELLRLLGAFPLLIHNDKDSAATTVAHKLGLTGPAFAVGSACSSSLVAVHVAVGSLLSGECDMALAGGVSVQVPQGQGYVYTEDGIYSPDGHCRPFDASARGTVGGSGAAFVLLKRWADAARDGDHVHAVIRGSAVNNDGGATVGFTAPSVAGQAAVIAEALAVADTNADTIGYIEAHGTGTQLGDVVEVAALSQAFGAQTARTGFCALGSAKANVGHLDAAAGVTGLIRAVLAVEDGQVPPQHGYERPNPAIGLPDTPFYVPVEPAAWRTAGPRRAGVSSFGIGGTNAHVIVEQAAALPARSAAPRAWQPVLISAPAAPALDETLRAVAHRVAGAGSTQVENLAFTLAMRHEFAHRAAVVCRADEASVAFAAPGPAPLRDVAASGEQPVVFLFPGQGSQAAGLAAGLYRDEPVFRTHLSACAELLTSQGVDLLAALTASTGAGPGPAPGVAGPCALFAVEYALARTLIEWGLTPSAMTGHSLGEYTAAAVAGVLSLEDALHLVVSRAALHDTMPPGRMLAVGLPEPDLAARLPAELSIAAVNSPGECVVAGPLDAAARFEDTLRDAGVPVRRLAVSHAFHSPLVDPLLGPFARVTHAITPRPSLSRWISTVSGAWVEPGDTMDAAHWVRHLRDPVRFGTAARRLLDTGATVFLEVGPGTTLTSLLRRQAGVRGGLRTLACQPSPGDGPSQLRDLVTAVAGAWVAGCPVDWEAFFRPQQPRRVPAPLYPFQGERHWVDPRPAGGGSEPGASAPDGHRHRGLALDPVLPELERRGHELSASAAVQDIAAHAGLAGRLDELCCALALSYLTESGVGTAPGRRYRSAELARELAVLPAFERFREFLLTLLEEDGVLARGSGTVEFLDGRRPREPQEVADEIKRAHPGFSGLADLLLHCGMSYPSALSTPGAALGVLYPGGRGDLLAETLAERTVTYSHTGWLVRLAADLVRMAADATPDRPLRLLEVGAGGGRLTWAVGEALRGRDADYHVTDVSRLFTEHLAAEAARRDIAIQVGAADITGDLAAQGYPAGGFDVVLGLDVVHAVPDIPAALANLRTTLRPGGLLVLIETTAQDRWLSMIWGLSPGWWEFSDALRQRTPLLEPRQWEQALAGREFATRAVLPASQALRAASDAVLAVAQAPAAGPAAVAAGHGAGGLEDLPEKRPDLGDWCWLPGWQGSAAVRPAADATGTACLVFSDGSLGAAVAERLRQLGGSVLAIEGQERAAGRGGDPGTAEDQQERYAAILAALPAGKSVAVAHLWSAGDPPAGTPLERLGEVQRRGLFSLLGLCRAVGSRAGLPPVRLLAVTSHAQDVLGDDLSVPERAPVHAAAKVIPQEYPQIACSSLDVPVPPPGSGQERWLAARIADELLAAPDAAVAAYRGRRRWVPAYTPQRLEPLGLPAPRLPRPGGVYLICGGLGGIGLSLADYLMRLPADVILVRRAPFPPRASWRDWLRGHRDDDPTSRAISQLISAESAGGRVLVRPADVADLGAMRTVVAQAVDAFGPITGVVHAAGVPDQAGMIQRRADDDTWLAIAAKVRGPLVLDEVLREQPLEFMLLCSSIGTVLPKLKFGEVGYVAGNEFLNAYAARAAAPVPDGDPAGSDPAHSDPAHSDPADPPASAGRPKPVTIAVSWTDWTQAGMWAAARHRLTQRYDVASSATGPGSDLLRGITTAEGVEIFRRLLAHHPAPHVVISTQDLGVLLGRHQAFTAADHLRVLDTMRSAHGPRRRPDLPSACVPPRTALERAVVREWSLLLGIEELGVTDDFFALGGDSLLALRLLASLRDNLGIDRTVAQLFAAPTIAELLHSQADTAGAAEPDTVVL
jgi:acyl transferase domain-containing protein/SAM-dependent methyltransferase/aryl carrier-like protein